MCIVEIPRTLLESIGMDGTRAEHELSKIIHKKIEDEEKELIAEQQEGSPIGLINLRTSSRRKVVNPFF